MAEFKDLTPNGQKAADACIKHGVNQIQANTEAKPEEGLLNNPLVNAYARWKGFTNEKDAYSNSTKAIDGTKASLTLKEDCIDEVHNNELKGKTPLWEPPAKKTSEASSDKGKVADAKPQSGELSDFAMGVSKFVSGIVSMFGSKDGNPEPIISSSSDTMIGRMMVNKHNTPSPQVQQDLPPVPKTAAKGRL